MKSYAIGPAELGKKAKFLAQHGADVVYVVDSAGGMVPRDVAEYFKAIRGESDVRAGFHAHNNLELAGANCLVAMEAGCTLLDCSIGGLGRSAGNTRTELMIPVLKAMGVPAPYDYLEVLRVWEQIIAPIIRRRHLGPVEPTGGYALVHSERMGPFREAADKHGVRVEALLDAFGDATRVEKRPEPALDALAAGLAAKPGAKRTPEGAPSALLAIGGRHAEPHHIRNSFRSVGEVFAAAQTLASKAYLPIVAVVQLEAFPPEEEYVTAEYLYHDDHFVVLDLMFGSVDLLVRTLEEHGRALDTVILDRAADAALQALEARRSAWPATVRTFRLDLTRVRAQHLFATLAQVVRGDGRVVFFGGEPGRLQRHLPDELEAVGFYRASARPYQHVDVDPEPLFRATRPRAGADTTFDALVLLTAIAPDELEALCARLTPGAVVVDCADAVADARPLTRAGATLLPLSLARCTTGELKKLHAVEGLDALRARPAAGKAEAHDLHAAVPAR